MSTNYNFFKARCFGCNKKVFIYLGTDVIAKEGYICPFCDYHTLNEEVWESLIIGAKNESDA
jgi:hypothetical protein